MATAKPKEYIKTISFKNIFPGKVTIVFTSDLEYSITKRSGNYRDNVSARTLFDDGHPIILAPVDIALDHLMHEIAHATFAIIECPNFHITTQEHEIFCYILDYLVAQIFTFRESICRKRITISRD